MDSWSGFNIDFVSKKVETRGLKGFGVLCEPSN